MSILKKYSDYIILILVALILILLLIIITDMHVASINKQMDQTALYNTSNPKS